MQFVEGVFRSGVPAFHAKEGVSRQIIFTELILVVVIFGLPMNYFTFTNVVSSNFQIKFANVFAVAYLRGLGSRLV